MVAGITDRKFLIVDDDACGRQFLRNLLVEKGAAEVLEADEFERAAVLCEQRHPQIVIAETYCSNVSALELLTKPRLTEDAFKLVLFTNCGDPDRAVEAVRAGASAFIAKTASVGELIEAFQKIDIGDRYIDHAMAMRMIFSMQKLDDLMTGLSRHESDVLGMLGEGKTMTQVAVGLDVAYKTVVATRSRLKRKLRVANTDELSSFARRCASKIQKGLTKSFR